MIAAIAAAFAFALQLAETKRRLQHAENDSEVALAEQSALNKKKDQEKVDIKAMADARINELTQTISDLKPEVTTETNSSHDAVLLDETKVNILKLLFSHDKLTTEQVSTSQHLQLQTAKYHLVDLANRGLVRSQKFSEQVPGLGPFHPSALRRYSAWIIMQPGRKFLIDNGHVS